MLTLNPLIFRSSTSVLNHVCFLDVLSKYLQERGGDRASSVQNVVQCVHPAAVSHVRQSSVFPVFTLSFLVKFFVGYLLRLFLMAYLSNLQLKQPML